MLILVFIQTLEVSNISSFRLFLVYSRIETDPRVMGYYSQPPAKLPPGKSTPLQSCLWSISQLETLEILEKIIRNITIQPTEAKYRSLKLNNAKIAATIGSDEYALEALHLLGWTEEAGVLSLEQGKVFTMKEVKEILNAQDRLKRSQKDLSRSKSAAKLPTNSEQEKIKALLDADRRERQCHGPITEPSIAQNLPQGMMSTSEDIGCEGSGCC